uniref:MARVEL domain-containing protein n=1 Tax=Acrobeloides nanus TaxID=290746 RepID=A0A914C122_9BILA
MLREEDEIRQETTVDLNRDAPPGPQSPVPHHDSVSAHPPPPTHGPSVNRKQQFTNMTKKIKLIPSNRKGQLNTTFLSTIPGVLKIAEILIGFIVFILAICTDRRTTGAAWAEHISFETIIVVSLFLLGYVVFPHLTLRDEQTREGLIVVELLFYGLNTLLYFIAIWLMIFAGLASDGRGAAIMAAILCVALTVIYAVETFIKLRAWRGENASSLKVVNNEHTTTTGAYSTHELRRDGTEVA